MRVGIVGAGTVGGGVIDLLGRNAALIGECAGEKVEISGVAVRDVAKAKSRRGDAVRWTDDWRTLTSDPGTDVIVEVMGGLQEAKACTLDAIANGKAVVTANKALLAEQGGEVFAAVRERGGTLKFEAAIAGAIPIVKVLREALTANHVHSIVGIVNGTCNYILTSMEKGNGTFAECLAEAQRLGYAEADPALDIDGVDSAHKIVLLGMIAMGTPLEFSRVPTMGISEIDTVDISFAEEMGYRIRLLAIAKRDDGQGVELMVHPTLLPADHIMAKVDRNMNAVSVVADAAGEIVCQGAGAGAMPTASAVVADLVEIARGGGAAPWPARDGASIVPAEEIRAHSFYLRMLVQDRPGVLARVSGILADAGISIGSMVQRESHASRPVNLVMILHRNRFGRVVESVRKIEALDFVSGSVKVFPVETLSCAA